MQWRGGGVVLITMLVVLSGFAGPAAGAQLETGVSPGTTVTKASATTNTAELCEGGPPDPESDVLGWEAGCWYNQSISVNQTDGLNSSERNATVARTMARVELIRQLEFQHTVPVEIDTRESFQASRANQTTSAALNTFDNAKFEALFLIGENEDSIDVQNENTGVSVLGFYSPAREAIVLISEEDTELQLDEVTLAHELVHALQDQHFNLSRFDARTRDGANAQNGLIEGDASLVDYRYEQRCQGTGSWNGTCLSQSGGGGGGSLANVGTYLVKFQPYSNGPSFIQFLFRQGGWEAVNAAYEDSPKSSEQVIHPEKYGEDQPADVHLDDRNSPAWNRVRPPNRPDYGEVGEAALFIMLWYPGYDSQRQTEVVPYESLLNLTGGEISNFQPYFYVHPASAGWDGDRLHVYENDPNQTAYVWRLVWDTPADATEFIDSYTQVLEYWGGEEVEPGLWVIDGVSFADAFHITVEDDTVTIVNAPTVEQLEEVRAGTLRTPTPTTPSPSVSTTTLQSPGTSPVPTPVPSPSPTTSQGQPGFGFLTAVAGLSAGLLWWRRR